MKLWDVVIESKSQMQSKEKNNGVTYAVIGSSGCGKSTMLRKVFLDRVYGSMAEKEYIITMFTESDKSDALEDVPKKVMVDSAGFDEEQFNFYYQTNQAYDKKFNFVAMMDDCIHIRYRRMIEKMFLIMRNTNITSIVSLQYPKLIPVSIRTSVYYSFCFCMNNDEGTKMCVESYIGPYLPGNSMKQKMWEYRQWACEHRFFFLDNLEHKCYKVDAEYNCFELPLWNVLKEKEGDDSNCDFYAEDEEYGSSSEGEKRDWGAESDGE